MNNKYEYIDLCTFIFPYSNYSSTIIFIVNHVEQLSKQNQKDILIT